LCRASVYVGTALVQVKGEFGRVSVVVVLIEHILGEVETVLQKHLAK
jgi:hypothetical protein